MAFTDDWKFPSEAELEKAVDDAAEDVKALLAKAPDNSPHTGTKNRRTENARSAAGELYADDSGTTSKSFETQNTGVLSREIINTNTAVVGYLVKKDRVIITDESEAEAQKILDEKIGELFK